METICLQILGYLSAPLTLSQHFSWASSFFNENPMLGSILPLVLCFLLKTQLQSSFCLDWLNLSLSPKSNTLCFRCLFYESNLARLESKSSFQMSSFKWFSFQIQYFSCSLQRLSYNQAFFSASSLLSPYNSILYGFLKTFLSCTCDNYYWASMSQSRRSPLFFITPTVIFLPLRVDYCSLTVFSNWRWVRWFQSLLSFAILSSSYAICFCWAIILSSFLSIAVFMYAMMYFFIEAIDQPPSYDLPSGFLNSCSFLLPPLLMKSLRQVFSSLRRDY